MGLLTGFWWAVRGLTPFLWFPISTNKYSDFDDWFLFVDWFGLLPLYFDLSDSKFYWLVYWLICCYWLFFGIGDILVQADWLNFRFGGLISSVQFLRFTDWFYGVEHIILRFNDWFDVTDCSVWEHSSFRFTDCFHVNTFILCFGLSDCFFRFHSHYFEFCQLAWCYWLVFGVGDILVEFDWLISDLWRSGDQQFFRFYWLTGFTLKSFFNVSVWVTGFKVSLTFS